MRQKHLKQLLRLERCAMQEMVREKDKSSRAYWHASIAACQFRISMAMDLIELLQENKSAFSKTQQKLIDRTADKILRELKFARKDIYPLVLREMDAFQSKRKES